MIPLVSCLSQATRSNTSIQVYISLHL